MPPAASQFTKATDPRAYDELLICFQSGDEGSATALLEDAQLIDRLLIMARSRLQLHAPFLNLSESDLADDVLQMMWCLVVERQDTQSRFNPSQGSAITYFWLLMRDAAKAVYEAYASPRRLLPRKNAAGKNVKGKVCRSRAQSLDLPITAASSSGPSQLMEVTLGDTIPDPTDSLSQAVERSHAEDILNLVRQEISFQVSVALEHVYRRDMTLLEAASCVGISRFALRRQLSSLAKTHREYLVA